MTILFGIAAAVAMQTTPVSPTTGWTWTLYDGDGPVVLANEVPDTPHLSTTLECHPGSGEVRLNQYQPGVGVSGSAILSSGRTETQVDAVADARRVQIRFRASEAVFADFVETGHMDLAVKDDRWKISVERPSWPRLRRFAQLCIG